MYAWPTFDVICLFVFSVISHFGFERRIWVLLVIAYLFTKYSMASLVSLKANPDYKRLKQVPNLIISLDTEVATPIQLSNTPQNPITDLIGY